MRHFWRLFSRQEEEGAILTEALIVIPVITIFAVGIMEFGNVFWQRQLMELGVRDAARYWSRCRPVDADDNTYMPCSIDTARNIAFYGHPDGNPDGTRLLRVPNWSDPTELTIEPETPPIFPTDDDVIIVTGTMEYYPSPLFSMLSIGAIPITYIHQQRYMGW